MRRRCIAALTASLMAGTLGVAVATPAHAAVDQRGTVVFVADGDTVDVDIAGDGTSTPVRIRIIGLQAMELTTYSSTLSLLTGECHAVAATKRMHELVHGKEVRITARSASSTTGKRLWRSIAVWRDGAWRDVGRIMVREGLALPNPHATEYRWNKSYQTLGQRAAKEHVGIYKRNACGSGPYMPWALKVWVRWDAPGNDALNPNGEYIKVRNTTTRTLSLGGWWVRDSALRRYTFPASTKLGPGKSLYVHPGKGKNTATRFYWGLSGPIFANVSGAPTNMGDGGFLFDPQGDLRAWHMYPNRL